MKTSMISQYKKICSRKVLLGLASVVAVTATLQAEIRWISHENGNYSWSDTANWELVVEGEDPIRPIAPGNPETDLVRVQNLLTGRSFSITFTGNQILTGGLIISNGTTNSGLVTYDLNGYTLTIGGGALSYDGGSGAPTSRIVHTFGNGTIQVGTNEQAADIQIAGHIQQAAGTTSSTLTIQIEEDAVLNTWNTSNIRIASGDSITRVHNVALDTSEATLMSGVLNDALIVSGNMEIGNHITVNGGNAGSPFVKRGQFLLGNVELVQVGQDLILGQSQRTNQNNYDVAGTLSFAGDSQGKATLEIGRDLRIGVGPQTTGSVLNSPELDVTIGSASQRGGVVYIGYKNTAGGYIHNYLDPETEEVISTEVRGHAVGTWVAGEGTWNAWVTELRIGEVTTGVNGNASGVLDLREMELGVFDISGAAVIGRSATTAEAAGSLYLKGGVASSASLVVGASTNGDHSVLELNGTYWSTGSVQVGTLGNVIIDVGNGSGGLDILSSVSDDFLIEGDGVINVVFDQMSTVWGIRMQGNQMSLFEDYLQNGRIVGFGGYGAFASVHYDEGYTYYGIFIIPEPATVTLWLLGGVGLLILFHSRKRKSC